MARILVIEDNAENLELMCYLLGAFGHSTLTARDGEQGIGLARAERPDLVLCDVHLPDLDGYAVVRRLKSDAALGGIPVVAVSALAAPSDRARGLSAGFDGYVAKPVDPETFVAEIEHFLPSPKRGSAPAAAAVTDCARVSPTRVHTEVLVVDDVPLNCELLHHLLTPLGYRVQLASGVGAALELVTRTPFDLVISDLRMPDADGIELVRRLKADARTAPIPVILVTSSVWGEAERHSALALGVARFLLRPIEPGVLVEEIAACLGAAKGKADGHHPDR